MRWRVCWFSNLTISWGDDRTVANLSWTAPTEGVHGGYVDPSALTYKVYKYNSNSWPNYTELGSTEGDTSVEVSILDAAEAQDQYVFGVTAVGSEGESDYYSTEVELGVRPGETLAHSDILRQRHADTGRKGRSTTIC